MAADGYQEPKMRLADLKNSDQQVDLHEGRYLLEILDDGYLIARVNPDGSTYTTGPSRAVNDMFEKAFED